MLVAFINAQAPGNVIEPPKLPHVTVKKKFKLIDIDERSLIKLLQNSSELRGAQTLRLGSSKIYDNQKNKYIEIINSEPWVKLHEQIASLLNNYVESRDPHFEGKNYLPHVTWKLKGKKYLDPSKLINTTHVIECLYLIRRIHPEKSIAKVITKITL